MEFSTNHLLDLCRIGKATKNEIADTAAVELCSYIVFASLWENKTTLPTEMLSRLDVLNDVFVNPEKYPEDMVEDDPEIA